MIQCDFCTRTAKYGVQVEGAKLGAYTCPGHLTTAVDDALSDSEMETEVVVWLAEAQGVALTEKAWGA